MKKLTVSITSVLLSLIMAFALVGCGPNAPTDDGTVSFVTLDINPGIELTVDGTNKVVSVKATNEDGEVLLYGETGIEGVDIEAAIAKITDLAVDYGYLDESNKVVGTTVSSSSDAKASDLLDKINAKITATAQNSGLTVTTDGEGAYSLLKKMQELKAQYPGNTAIQNLTVSDFKLVASAVETGEVSVEVAVTMDDEELINLVKNAHTQIETYATEQFKRYQKLAESTYLQAEAAAMEAVYAKFYTAAAVSHIDTFHLGWAYQMFKSGEIGFNALASLFEVVGNIKTVAIEENQVSGILTALGLDASQIDLIKDNDGNITIQSIEDYADIKIKNTPAGDELNAIKDSVNQQIESYEGIVADSALSALDIYETSVQAVINAARSAGNTLNTNAGFIGNLPGLDGVKSELNAYIDDFDAIVDTIATKIENSETVTAADLRTAAAACKTKADAILALINADLSESEKAQIQSEKELATATLTAAKAQLTATLESAATAARQRIEQLKNNLKNA